MAISTRREGSQVINIAQLVRGERRVSLSSIIKGGYEELRRRGLPQIPDFSIYQDSVVRASRITDWLDLPEVKATQNGITGIFTSEIFLRLKELPEFKKPPKTFSELAYIANNGLSDPRIPDERDPLNRMNLLQRYSILVGYKAVKQWQEDIEMLSGRKHLGWRELTQQQQDRLDAYEWLSKVLPLYRQTQLPGFNDFADNVASFIRGGFGTATHAIWASLYAFPKVYESYVAQHGPLTRRETDEIGILPFVTRIATGNKEIAIPLINALTERQKNEPIWQYHSREINPSYLEISEVPVLGTNKQPIVDRHGKPLVKRFLNINHAKLPELFDRVSGTRIIDIKSSWVGTGCPAGYTDAIADLFDWSQSMYKRYGLPDLVTVKPSGFWFARRRA